MEWPMYVYLIKAGDRRDQILGCYTRKAEMRRDFMALYVGRQDMLVTRHLEGQIVRGVVLRTADILANKMRDY